MWKRVDIVTSTTSKSNRKQPTDTHVYTKSYSLTASGYNSLAAFSASASASPKGPAGLSLTCCSSVSLALEVAVELLVDDVAELELELELSPSDTALDSLAITELISLTSTGGRGSFRAALLASLTLLPSNILRPGSAFPSAIEVCSSFDLSACSISGTTTSGRPSFSPPIVATGMSDFCGVEAMKP